MYLLPSPPLCLFDLMSCLTSLELEKSNKKKVDIWSSLLSVLVDLESKELSYFQKEKVIYDETTDGISHLSYN